MDLIGEKRACIYVESTQAEVYAEIKNKPVDISHLGNNFESKEIETAARFLKTIMIHFFNREGEAADVFI